MRSLHLNLAARPYRDYRPVYLAAAAMAVLAAILMLNNVQTAYRYFAETKSMREQIANLEQQAANQESVARSIETNLAAVDMKALNRQTRFINAQIEERSFSWSGLLDQLERILPSDVRLLNLNPQVSKDGAIALNLSCVGKSSDSMVRTLDRLFSDPHFRNPFPRGFSENADGTYRFDIDVSFYPVAQKPVQTSAARSEQQR